MGLTPTSILLTQRWAKTECKASNLTDNPACNSKQWTLHGLWPGNVKVIDPVPLSEDFFNTFENYENIMRTEWTFLGIADQNTYITETKTFWKHEWTKHGYCAKDFIGSEDPKIYFQEALRLYRRANLLSILADNNVTPNDNATYRTYQIINAFDGLRPHVNCRKIGNKYYLSEIIICLNQNLKPVNCGTGDTNVCPEGAITYPET
ncbi:ribonuclease T2-like [Huso huso]|uniref:Ribonuclease T2-like n=1 Tax=Huso huso TaxID=61971 RepID=A0ABR0Y8U7_HUSHU